MRKTLSIILVLLAALCVPAAAQQQSWYFAYDYGTWSIPLQSANTYLVQGANACLESNGKNLFFPFKVSTPVLISDATTSLSEVVSPSSVTDTSGQCGITASPVNQHRSAQLKSGTAGLQEAINNLGSASAFPQIVYIDQRWYQLAGSIPNTTPAGIIASVTGSSAITIVDLTAIPSVAYAWSGTSYVTVADAGPYFQKNVSSYTTMTVPTALSSSGSTYGLIATSTTGGTIPTASTYRLAATYVDASGGETLISTDTSATIVTGAGATNSISVTSPAALTGAVGWRLYMTAAGGSTGTEILYTPTCSPATAQGVLPGTCAIGATATISAIVTGTATVPTVSTAFARTTAMSASFPPFTALGTVTAGSTANLALVNFPAGFFNTLGRSIQLCGNGYATTNSTAGTLTLASTFASVPNVTSITPWSVVSGSTAASAQADPFNFCATITTAATGSTGTLEMHGCVNYSLSGTAAYTAACDTTIAVSSTVDLTKADQITFTIKPTTTALTAAQLRQLIVTQLN